MDKRLQYCTLVRVTDGEKFTFKCAEVIDTNFNTDWLNWSVTVGNLGDNMDTFIKEHNGESFYFNGLTGIVCSIRLTNTSTVRAEGADYDAFVFSIQIGGGSISSLTRVLSNAKVEDNKNNALVFVSSLQIGYRYYPDLDKTEWFLLPYPYIIKQLVCNDGLTRYGFAYSHGIVTDISTPYTIKGVDRTRPELDLRNGSFFTSTENNIHDDRFCLTYDTLGFDDSLDYEKQNGISYNLFPYGNNSVSESKGGNGTMEDTSDTVELEDLPEVPTIFAGGLFNVYGMEQFKLQELESFLLSDNFLSAVKHLFTDPIDYITNIRLMPVDYSVLHGGSPEGTIEIGGIDSHVGGKILYEYFAEINFGSVPLREFFETFMDYSPYTKITIYLPYIGYKQLNVDLFQNHNIILKYRIDVVSGTCVAFLFSDTQLISTYVGNCAYMLPIRSRDYSDLILSCVNFTLGTATEMAKGNYMNALGNTIPSALDMIGAFKNSSSSTGSLSPNASYMCNRTPYLIIERPSISFPKYYGSTVGYRSGVGVLLNKIKGFTVVKEIHLENITATDNEKAELEKILKSGVIL